MFSHTATSFNFEIMSCFSMPASRAMPHCLNSFLRSPTLEDSSRSTCWSTSAAFSGLSNLPKGMPLASHCNLTRSVLLAPPKTSINRASCKSFREARSWKCTPRVLHSDWSAERGISCQMLTCRSRATISPFSTQPSVGRPWDLHSMRTCFTLIPLQRSHSCSTLLAPALPRSSKGMPSSAHCVGRELSGCDSSATGTLDPCGKYQGKSAPKAKSNLQTSWPADVWAASASGLPACCHSLGNSAVVPRTRSTRMVSRASWQLSWPAMPAATARATGASPAASRVSTCAECSTKSLATSAALSQAAYTAQACNNVRPAASTAASTASALAPRASRASWTPSTLKASTAARSNAAGEHLAWMDFQSTSSRSAPSMTACAPPSKSDTILP
mmetsp:Transcript_10430/g.32390  ORF Transcript_10430/g.32390 Transcript_10430/m.32390 type:complete len:387 (-) Transcript_10430:102-1262(-)